MTPNEYKNLEAGNGKGIIVKSNFIDYKFPTTYPDNLILATKMGKLQKDRFSQLTLLVSEKHERVIAKCETVVVSFNHSTLQKEPLPAFYQDAYEKCTKEFGLQDEWETSKI
jgi:acyl-CoA thioester hydrolase